jgi:ethanolamine ammonia-lyase small subunit
MNSSDNKSLSVIENPWATLKQFTSARIALGRSGISIPTHEQLKFQLAHAQARDAVHHPLDVSKLCSDLKQAFSSISSECIALHSAAIDRTTYLKRPDFGKRLSPVSRELLLDYSTDKKRTPNTFDYDVAFVIVDGLSALAIETNALRFLQIACTDLQPEKFKIAPFCVVEQGRVAIGDEIGELLRAKLVVVMIGERPGLSSPASMGIYLTWHPKVGLTDESRNCISNIHSCGLSDTIASMKLRYLVAQAHKRGLSGVALKDETSPKQALGALNSFLIE